MGFRVEGLGFRVSGFTVEGLGFRVEVSCAVWGRGAVF